MAMICIKTGCHLYDAAHDMYYLGDLYSKEAVVAEDTVFVLKYRMKQREPFRPEVHAKAYSIDLDTGPKDNSAGNYMAVITSMYSFSYEGE